MTEQADERLRVLNASLKEALGKLTGSDELEAQGVRERTDNDAAPTVRTRSKTAVERKAGASTQSSAKSSARSWSASAAKTVAKSAAKTVAKPAAKTVAKPAAKTRSLRPKR